MPTLDERFDALYLAAKRKRMDSEFSADLGSPATIGAAREVWRHLPDFDPAVDLDRVTLHLKYDDEIEW